MKQFEKVITSVTQPSTKAVWFNPEDKSLKIFSNGEWVNTSGSGGTDDKIILTPDTIITTGLLAQIRAAINTPGKIVLKGYEDEGWNELFAGVSVNGSLDGWYIDFVGYSDQAFFNGEYGLVEIHISDEAIGEIIAEHAYCLPFSESGGNYPTMPIQYVSGSFIMPNVNECTWVTVNKDFMLIALNMEGRTDGAYEYVIILEVYDTVPTIEWDNAPQLIWKDGNGPVIQANCIYEIHIFQDILGVWAEYPMN